MIQKILEIPTYAFKLNKQIKKAKAKQQQGPPTYW